MRTRTARPVQVAIGMGSNLGARERHLARGVRALARLLSELAVSPVYETTPFGDVRQPDYLNLCCVGSTDLPARTLLETMLRVEQSAGRRRTGRRFGPRTLDLDLLLYGGSVFSEADLEVPHPRMAERAFVLVPLRDLAPDWRHPVLGRSIAELTEGVDASGVRRFGDAPPTVEDGDEGTGGSGEERRKRDDASP
ncbi:MAG: 2-amino-4-hydroxy-6-hydroxymethyldihydropteridine diphosphokinase [Candidatus Palauibacterales bacterium]|nr:2-amino-4-hydroxy-6-hydroxymethyldihydropteridine diphosphokinase [Candidatus Palauibacterales bacterium]MDP2584837.1 2-amino-4-hydroxy-6-hydroxymethyldihydropteridine diphosphokinase [Candidatus Palauibacterales bacterium]